MSELAAASAAAPTVFWCVLLFIIGACLGSFGNVVIYRWPKKLSVVFPGSFCFSCKKPVAFYDNIPIFSFFILRGKCRHCKAQYSMRYAVIELLSGLIFVGLYLKLGLSVTLVECLILCWGMLVASTIDLDHRLLPDVLTLPGILIGFLGSWLNPERTVLSSLSGVLFGGGTLWLVAYLYSVLKKQEGMGGGDIKLLAWIGAVLGFKSIIFTIIVSSILGSVVGLMLAAKNRSGLKTSIPFGPFLSFAAFLYIFLGEPLVQAYLNFFFPAGS